MYVDVFREIVYFFFHIFSRFRRNVVGILCNRRLKMPSRRIPFYRVDVYAHVTRNCLNNITVFVKIKVRRKYGLGDCIITHPVYIYVYGVVRAVFTRGGPRILCAGTT